ncbi:MAG: ethanolamine ammonia-lyase light chain EutC, partial [Byssovorax sp.]
GKAADKAARKAMLHIIGERPGSEHHSFSVYLSAPTVEVWSQAGALDHNVSKVVANIADTALAPEIAADQTVTILQGMFPV